MTATGNEAVTIAQVAKALDVDAQNSGATGDESVRLRQLKMLRDSLTGEIDSGPAFIEVGSPSDTSGAFNYGTFAIWEVDGFPLPILSFSTVDNISYSVNGSDDNFDIAIEGTSVSVTSSAYGLIALADFDVGSFEFSTDITWRFFVPKFHSAV